MLLLFKRQFFSAIQSGKKTTTLRRWSRPFFRAGQCVRSPHVGWLRIQACEVVELNQLKESDAQADGFESLADLFKSLKTIYPQQDGDGKRWYRLAFRAEDSPPPQPKAKGERTTQARKIVARQLRSELDNVVRATPS